MNRYSPRKIVLDPAADRSGLISGIFKSGDIDAFAMAAARLCDLTVDRKGDRVKLSARR